MHFDFFKSGFFKSNYSVPFNLLFLARESLGNPEVGDDRRITANLESAARGVSECQSVSVAESQFLKSSPFLFPFVDKVGL